MRCAQPPLQFHFAWLLKLNQYELWLQKGRQPPIRLHWILQHLAEYRRLLVQQDRGQLLLIYVRKTSPKRK